MLRRRAEKARNLSEARRFAILPPTKKTNKKPRQQTHNKLILFIFSFVRLVRFFAHVSGGQSGQGSGLLSQNLLGQKFTPRGGGGGGRRDDLAAETGHALGKGR